MRKRMLLVAAIFVLAVSTANAKTIVKNELIVPKQPDTYLEVRHIVLAGTNQEIGKALADIGKEWLDVKLMPYESPLYAQARRAYMAKNYPILLERMKGVAKSFGLAPNTDKFATNQLLFDVGGFGCSALFLSPAATANGHALLAHNMDFYTITMAEMNGLKPAPGDHGLFSRDFVIELYPDKGYPSIVIGTFDLLNGLQSGMNSQGLVVAIHVDHDAPVNKAVSDKGDNFSGLNMIQIARLILDTCATAEQAKVVILNNKIAAGFLPCHIMVSDRAGKSFIFETSGQDFSSHLTDNSGKPQIMTNHPVYKYPDPDKFPAYSPKATYNTFYRYRALDNFVKNHPEKFSRDDLKKAISLVYAHTHDMDEGASLPSPCRTLFNEVYDLTDLSVEAKFYLKDGPTDPNTGDPTLVFTAPFKFKLDTNKKSK